MTILLRDLPHSLEKISHGCQSSLHPGAAFALSGPCPLESLGVSGALRSHDVMKTSGLDVAPEFESTVGPTAAFYVSLRMAEDSSGLYY